MRKSIISLNMISSLVATTTLPTFVSAEEIHSEGTDILNGEQIFNSLENSNATSVYDVPVQQLWPINL
ncbi:hypothetical protein HB852_10480 [Listeria grandensis]|uniref:Uncharacterized protein n=1 Tax=Listeria grandensis TaxID=1494963 RepID=A0A7X1CQH7_9LIST|nr:hypothetical protein [Listeria grandensis]MBC1475044.1 hypothetical protein [Listeria grandensis]MBC1937046.1 hypothetical protein [Listeria grandensis]